MFSLAIPVIAMWAWHEYDKKIKRDYEYKMDYLYKRAAL